MTAIHIKKDQEVLAGFKFNKSQLSKRRLGAGKGTGRSHPQAKAALTLSDGGRGAEWQAWEG